MIRSTLLGIPLVAAALAAAAPQPMVTFRSSFAGVAADGQHSTWEGPVDGAAHGRVMIALRQVEEPAAAADGWLAGSWAEVDGRIVNGDFVGVVSIVPAVAHH